MKTQCKCNEFEMCGVCTVSLEASMRRLRLQDKPDSDSISDVLEWRLARTTQTPSERLLDEDDLYKRLRNRPIHSEGIRVPVYGRAAKR